MTRRMVREQATALAVISGRSAQDVLKADWEQAVRQLTWDLALDPKRQLSNQCPSPTVGTR